MEGNLDDLITKLIAQNTKILARLLVLEGTVDKIFSELHPKVDLENLRQKTEQFLQSKSSILLLEQLEYFDLDASLLDEVRKHLGI